MTLAQPSHIKAAEIVGRPLLHDWSDANEQSVIAGDIELESRLRTISHLGKLGISLGAVEWLIWRLRNELLDDVPFQIVEAVWAGIVDWRYLNWRELPIGDWEELDLPVGEPLSIAFKLLQEMIFMVRDGGFVPVVSSSLAVIPLYVLPEPEPFKQWRRFAVRRLARAHPVNQDDYLGLPFPRAALDAKCNYELAVRAELVSDFLQNLDHAQNSFLHAPEEMIEQGFVGTPYA